MVDFVVVVDGLDDFEAGGLAAVELVAGVVGDVGVVETAGVVAVVAAVVVAATLADLPPEPSPQPALATIAHSAHRHTATPTGDIKRRAPPIPDRCCPPNL
ncbi:MAG TPA: hypothetical protein VNY27_01050 [Solirubrobacteraceae bacterium]|nr:hypothetical protein [Solirubrobacteraceae bacterium]